MTDVDLSAIGGAFDAGAVHVTLTGVVEHVEDAAQGLANQAIFGNLGAVLGPGGFHHADFGLVDGQAETVVFPELADLIPHLVSWLIDHQPAALPLSLQLHATLVGDGHAGL